MREGGEVDIEDLVAAREEVGDAVAAGWERISVVFC